MDRDSGKEKLIHDANDSNDANDTHSSCLNSEVLYCLYSIICCNM